MNRRIDLGCIGGFLFITAMVFVIFICGCQKAQQAEIDYTRPLPPGELALRKLTDPAQIPDMTIACFDLSRLREAIDNSLSYMSKPSSEQFFPYGDITHDHAVASLEALGNMLDSQLRGHYLAAAIKQNFDVYISVGCDDMGTVLFTGYYTPIFDGSLERTERFRFPLYKKPDDLAKSDTGLILGRQLPSGGFAKYPARAELESSRQLAGTELVWLSDAFEVYIAHVQGSAKIRLPDGELITVGYAANNGYEYNSVADQLIRDGKIRKEDLSLNSMIDYFKLHSADIDRYIRRNPRFVFFQMAQGDPRGSLNEPVISYRSIATDKSIYPRGCLTFLDTSLPRISDEGATSRKYTGFMLDQDTGGAIRAPGRCDVYMGVGDKAGKLAGRVYTEGNLYYLFLKPGVSTHRPN